MSAEWCTPLTENPLAGSRARLVTGSRVIPPLTRASDGRVGAAALGGGVSPPKT